MEKRQKVLRWAAFLWKRLYKKDTFLVLLVSIALLVLAVVLPSLVLTKQAVAFGRELALALLYGMCVAAFSMLVRRLAGSIRALSMVTPILVVVMLVICPVFFDLGALRQAQLFFPPTYFIIGAYQETYLLYMVIYTLAAWLLCLLWDRIRNAG